MSGENSSATVILEFLRSAPGSHTRARVSRRQGTNGRMQVVDPPELGGDLRWLVRLVPSLLGAL